MTNSDTVPGEGHTKGPMKWQSRNRPAFPGNEPEWEDCYVSAGEDEPAAGFWAQCEYRKVPVKAQGGQL